ncbi:hypothetical protein ISN45_Aa08g024300 [Arabidopsis thaliana x Arabidopsis arenosa]|uniref:Transmembrane protein n=1 Tax=Arabidopsis thaliana x Arabidopsis arenosa TaxID=1240361 RepID=A0A8T1XJZ3_9BRAS|nr:hypothetical protein ISN45_Aa08g024300 [Arabidopsis thaliana x Arabidopsis arenosa]
MEKRGFTFTSILVHSLWITLTGILLFTLSTTKNHNFGYIKFFSITGTLLITLPWIIQLLVTSVVILLHKTKGYNLMWIVQSPKSKEKEKENHHTNVATTTPTTTTSCCSSPLSSLQVLKKGDVDEYEIRIVIGADGPRSPKDGSSATPLGMLKEIEQGRNNTKLLTNGSPVAA